MTEFGSRSPLSTWTPWLLLGLVGLLVLWQLGRSESDVASPRDASVETHRAVEARAPLPPAAEPAASAVDATGDETPSTAASARAAASPTAFRFEVEDEDGAPLTRATLSWTPLTTPVLVAARFRDWEHVRQATLWATTDVAGEVSFATSPAVGEGDERRSVLWVTRPGHRAEVVIFEPEDVVPGSVRTVRLSRAPDFAARVVDGARAIVAGAAVRVHGVDTFRGDEEADERVYQKAYEVLVRDVETGPDGRVALPSFPHEALVVAQHGDDASPAWTGRTEGEVLLRLRDAFTASGTVVVAAGIEHPPSLRVASLARNGHVTRRLDSVPVAATGEWGPVTLPLVGAQHYVFRVEGTNALPDEGAVEPPAPGSAVRVELAAEPGHEVWGRVTDAEGQVPDGARMTLVHRDRYQVPSVEVGRPYLAEESRGFVLFQGLREGSATLEGSAPGYARASIGPAGIPDRTGSYWPVTLKPGAVVRGTVTDGGEPVEDFEIVYCRAAIPSLPWRRAFHDRLDGTFEIDDAPGETLLLFASTGDVRRSQPLSVEVRVGEKAEVALELAPPQRVRGRVVDQTTREPLAGARVQVWAAQGTAVLIPLGTPVQTDSAGHFDVTGLIPGSNKLHASAPGYSSAIVVADFEAGESPSVPPIALCASQPLEIVLLGDEATDYSVFTATVRGTESFYGLGFGSDGIARIPAASAGRAYLRVLELGGAVRRQATRLVPGRAWRFEVPVSRGPADLSVEVEREDAAAPGVVLWVSLHSTHGVPHAASVARVLGEDGTAHFAGLPTGRVLLRMNRQGSTDFVLHPLTLEEGSNSVRLAFREEPRQLRVVDGTGAPLEAVEVALDGPLLGGDRITRTTNGEGLCTFASLPPGSYSIHLEHPELGERIGIPLHVREGSDEVPELVLEADSAVRIRLVGGQTPLAGARCELYPADGSHFVAGGMTDAEGLVTWDPFGTGELRLLAHDPNHWPIDRVVRTVSADEPPVEVVARPRGDLRIEVVGGGAAAVDVALEDVATSERVADWLERGLLDASTGALRTDDAGALHLARLASGDYRWWLPSRPELRGTAHVPPYDAGELRIVLPSD